MNYGLYPGCSLEGSSREYAESLRAIAPRIGLALDEMEGWNCCGASAAHSLDHTLAIELPHRILAQATEQQMGNLLVPCAACFNRLATAQHTSSSTTPHLHTILDVLTAALTPEALAAAPATFPHKVVCYYGCLLVRPAKVIHATRSEDPMAMDDIMKRLGATPLAWGMKTECCGAGLSVSRTDVVGELSGRILSDAEARGAAAIIVACPMCHSNLDMRRKQAEHALGRAITMPVLFVTQAVGLALGMEPQQLGLQRHFVPVTLRGKSKAQPAARPTAAASA